MMWIIENTRFWAAVARIENDKVWRARPCLESYVHIIHTSYDLNTLHTVGIYKIAAVTSRTLIGDGGKRSLPTFIMRMIYHRRMQSINIYHTQRVCIYRFVLL